MLEGFAVRKYPEWEKVGYEKFDVGFFTKGKLNGYGKKYILEAIYQNNKRVGGYERITIGYFEDNLLNGIGIKIEDDEILEYGFYENDRLIDIDRLMHDTPMAIIDNFYLNNVNQGEVAYYGECVNGRRGTGRGVVVDRKDRMIIGNFVDNELIPGLYISIYKNKVTYGFITYNERSKYVSNILLDHSYRPEVVEEVPPKNDFGHFGTDENYSEGFFDENSLMQGLGFKNDGRESGIYKDDQLIFGSVDYDSDYQNLDDIKKHKYMLYPKGLNVKKLKYKDGIYIGEVEDGVPHGYGQYFTKSSNYKAIMDTYNQREVKSMLIGNTKNIPEDIKYGDVCYIATFRNGKMEGYCTRWVYHTNENTINYFWEYDEGIIAYKDRFRPSMTLFEYYNLRYSKIIKPHPIERKVFDLNNKAYCINFLQERIVVDTSETLLLDIYGAKYSVVEKNENEYELWIFLTEEENEKYQEYNELYIKNLLDCRFKKIGERSYLQNSGLFEVEVLDEGRNIRVKITKKFHY